MLYGSVTGFNPITKRPKATLEGRYRVELSMAPTDKPLEEGTLIWVTNMQDDEEGYMVADHWWVTDAESIRAAFAPVKWTWWDEIKYRLGF